MFYKKNIQVNESRNSMNSVFYYDDTFISRNGPPIRSADDAFLQKENNALEYQMGVPITLEKLFTGALDLTMECIKRKATPQTMFQTRNGEDTADMDAAMFRNNPDLYWEMKSSRLKIPYTDTPAFVDAYNKHAATLGITKFHVTLEHINFVMAIIIVHVVKSKAAKHRYE